MFSRNKDFFLILILLLASGNPAFIAILGKNISIIGPAFFFALIAFNKKIIITNKNLLFFAVFFAIGLIHFFSFGWLAGPAILGFMLKLFTAFLAVKVVKDFTKTYVQVVFYSCLLSFIFFLPYLILGESFKYYFSNFSFIPGSEYIHIGLYNFSHDIHASRNSGFMWEPTAFAGYLTLGLIFSIGNSIKNGKLILFNRVNNILLIGILSTQSSTAFIATFFLFLFSMLIGERVRKVKNILLFILVITISTISFLSLPFLRDKILDQADQVIMGASVNSGNIESTRFGNAEYDLNFISIRPIFGWGTNPETRSIIDSSASFWAEAQGNGLTGFIINFGIFGFIFYIYNIFLGFKFQFKNIKFAFIGIITVMLLLFGEQYTNYSLFLSLMFLMIP